MCGLRTYDKIRNPHRRVATKPQPYGERNRNPSGSETAALRVAEDHFYHQRGDGAKEGRRTRDFQEVNCGKYPFWH